jgi:5'-nucleotidase/2',3'-cyclic-nucleotide 2'-phosphodiesterase/3'-nucleotidase
MKNNLLKIVAILMILTLALPAGFSAQAATLLAPGDPVSFTLLHTNDFHGQLENKVGSSSNPGAARTANVIQTIRAAKEALGQDVLLFDGGDMMQGSLLSNIYQGEPVIDYFKLIGYDASVFGNHEFDWGQATLTDRAVQAADDTDPTKKAFPVLAANLTTKVAGSCDGWDPAVLTNGTDSYAVEPYTIFEVGPADNTVQIGVIGVTSVETPYITIASATEGLCFKDPAQSISYYYDDMLADGADFIVVLSHNGYNDGGYGYGFPVYGDQTLAARLNTAGTPANIIIGGHSHTNMTSPTIVGNTYIAQAYYNGRVVGQFDVTYDPTAHTSTIAWTRNGVDPNGTPYAPVADLVTAYASDQDYLDLINQEIGWTQVDLTRNYNGDGMMGSFIQDAVYGDLNGDAEPLNDVDMVFNNPGGIRTDLCAGTPCVTGLLSEPFLLTYGNMFTILPFGNATAVGDMTGWQIRELLNQSATLFKGALSVAGVRHKFYCYSETTTPGNPCAAPWAWGAYDIEVWDKATEKWLPLELDKVYRVATNEFLAPAGQDGFAPFKYMTNITYWGDMLDNVNRYVTAHYSQTDPYTGPDGDGTLDGRVTQEGDNISGPIVPITILHHNDSHGRLLQSGSTPGYTNLVTAIKQERAHNPDRTLLLTAGDNIQGDSMMYYFKSAGLGYAADGTPLPAELQINPLIKAFNTMDYAAMTLVNHEFNFGSEIFSTLSQANFPMLQANVTDTGAYGLDLVPVQDFTRVSVGPEAITVAIMGIGNHRIPIYELPSNIPGLTFYNPIETAEDLAPGLADTSEALIALTHIGFTTNPTSVEVDENVDTELAQQVSDIDVIIGGHSHTAPSGQFLDKPYQYLPTTLVAPDGDPVLVTQMNRYNTYLGQIVLGMRQKATSGIDAYELVSSTGKAIAITTSAYPEDADTKALLQPYADLLSAYNNTVIGSTITPIDTDPEGYTQETNGANLQADASVWKLEKELDIDIDFHLSGAMTNRLIASSATPGTPYQLKISDMFSAMPYENSLVVFELNGPQLKTLLERAYRNYFYYKYVPDYGGYSHYTTCMIDIDSAGQITYADTYPMLPNGNNVVSLEANGEFVDFTDADTYYNVSTVNYLAAGSCNNNNDGVTLWPLDQIIADTQYYVRDSVAEYIQSDDTIDPINPQVEGRLVFLLMDRYLFLPTLLK